MRGRPIKFLKPDVTRVVNDAAVRLGDNILKNVKNRTPRDKGNAQRGWRIKQNKQGKWKITNNVEYIGALNEGHSRQAPVNFIQKEEAKAIKDTKI